MEKRFRSFELWDKDNRKIDLQNLKNVITDAPSDLGVSFETSYLYVKDNYLLNDVKNSLGSISFKLIFMSPNAYDKYHDFMAQLTPTINARQDFKLYYNLKFANPKFNKRYFTNVFFKAVTKQQLNNFGNLEVDISLEKVTYWKNEIEKQWTFEFSKGGKKYPHKYTYKYMNTVDGIIEVVNEGQLEAPTEFTIMGKAIDPTIQIISVNDDKDINTLQLDYTIEEDEKLVIISDVRSQTIIRVDRNGKQTSIYVRSKMEEDKETFLYIPPGKYKIHYKSSEMNNGKVYVKYYEQFLSI